MALVDSLPYRPFAERGQVVDGRFRWRLGVRPLDEADWFEFGSDAEGSAGWIAEKREVLRTRRDTVVRLLEGIEPEAVEVAEEISTHLRTRQPGRPSMLDPSVHPLEAAAVLVPDDLVLLVPRDGRLVVGGGIVCFPNRWDLGSKIGLELREVHAPVAGLNEEIGHQIDAFFDRLTPQRSWWRLGWGIIDTAEGFAPPVRRRPPSQVPADLYIRIERETLRRFPATDAVLFTIRTYVAHLDAITDRRDRAAIADAVEAMSQGVREYKEVASIVPGLVRRLRDGT